MSLSLSLVFLCYSGPFFLTFVANWSRLLHNCATTVLPFSLFGLQPSATVVMTDIPEYDAQEKRLTREELEKHIQRVSAPKQPVEAKDPFPVCPSKKISQAELDKMTERLYTQSLQRKQANLEAIEAQMYKKDPNSTVDRTLSHEELDGAVDRLYTQALARKAASLEQTRSQYTFKPKETEPVKLNVFVQHMYDDRLAKKKATEQKLYDKYIASTEIRTAKLPKSQLEAAGSRLCTTK